MLTQEIARFLLGKIISTKINGFLTSGIIVETEAYLGEIDMAAHSYLNHHTQRNDALFKKAGTIYVYQMRGYFLLNIVTKNNFSECVLIRSIEPIKGIDIMEKRRKFPYKKFQLTNGPCKLCQALSIDLSFNNSFINEKLFLTLNSDFIPKKIEITPRIGIFNKGNWTNKKLRYFVNGNPYVSKILQKEVDNVSFGWKK